MIGDYFPPTAGTGVDSFVKTKYKVANSIVNDYSMALQQSIVEAKSTSAGSEIEVVRYWDFG